MPAPLLEVSGEQNGRRAAILTLDGSRLVQGFWTSAMPVGFSNSVQFLAHGNSPGLLQPGESGRVPIYYAGWQKPWDFNYPPINFDLSVLTADNTNAIDWNALKDFMRPSSMSDEAWTPVFANLISQTGPTWGDYVRMLNHNASYLAKLGQTVTDIRDLLSFEVMQAGGLSLTRTLTSAVDAQVQTLGLPLTFTRSFSSDIESRYALGRLGRGWSDNWDRTLTVAADGTVTIIGPNHSRRVFQPDSRSSSYFSGTGDYATLTALGGSAFTLTESDGTLYAFRTDGKLNYVQDTHANRITCLWTGNQLTRLTHSAGPFLDLAYGGSRLASITDSLGRQTTFVYDASGEHLQSTTDYRSQTTVYGYSVAKGTIDENTLTFVRHPDGTESTYTYDANGRLFKKAGCCGSPECTTYTYDAAGKITAADALGNSTQIYLDHRGRVARTINPLGNVTSRTYDSAGRLIQTNDPAGRFQTFTYDARGNLNSETDGLGYTTRYNYTTLNRLATVIDAKGNVTRYTYEADGDLASITYADGSRESWTYDDGGYRLTWTNRRGQTVQYTNDALGRVTARNFPDSTEHTFTYDAHGKLTSYTDPLGTTTQEFDADGRLAKITYPGDRWLSYTYDAAGRRASMTDQLGYRTEYRYDTPGRLETLTDETGAEIARYVYDAAGRISRKTLGNGVYTTYTYDNAGQLLELANLKPDSSFLSRFAYTYDNRGRRDTMTTTYGVGDPRTDLAGSWQYDYDDTGQLIGWTAPNGRRVDYTYDALGNRLNVRDNSVDTAYTVNNLNQYTKVGDTTYQYDADGNLTNKIEAEGMTTYDWSFDNKLVRIAGPKGVWENLYDAKGNRVRGNNDGAVTEFVIDPIGIANVVNEFAFAGNLISHYEHGTGLVSRRTAQPASSYFTYDALGSTSEVVGDSDTVSNAYTYLPFGELLFGQERINNALTFVGELGVMAEGNNLSFMRARYYDSSSGRFLSPDPIGRKGGDINLYRYVHNRTTDGTDPIGLCQLNIGKCFLPPNSIPWACLVCIPLIETPALPVCLELCMGATAVLTAKCVADAYSDYLKCLLDNIPPINPPPCSGDDCGNGGSGPSQPARPIDPNQLLGPSGYGPQNFVDGTELLPYRINFENESSATAPAHEVTISNPLSANLDWSTFELTEIGFGDRFIAVPPGTQHFTRVESMTFNGVSFEVHIEAGIRLATGEVYARFTSLDPVTGLPPAVDVGFLPSEDGTGRGQGHVSYVIKANVGLVSGTEIRNIAWIVFDGQPAIATNQVDPHDPSKGTDPNKECLITIAPETVNLSTNTYGGGSVTDPGIGTFMYQWGNPVGIEATPNVGFRFMNWTGDVDTIGDVYAAETTITMCGNFAITANFTPDTSPPDPFSFTDQTGVALNTEIISNSITVSGISTPATISITGGQYAINSGAFTSATGLVNNGDAIRVNLISAGTYSTSRDAVLTIGGVNDTFTVRTLAPPSMSALPASKDFGLINVGSRSASQIFEISNIGNANLVIGAITLSGGDASQFTKEIDTCSWGTVSPLGKCTVRMVFSPTSEGLKNETLSIPSNDLVTPSLAIALMGEGTLNPEFDDCQEDYWAEDFINTLYYSGITGGCAINPPRFCPDAFITRGQMAVFIGASLGHPPIACDGRFADVPTTHSFCGFIERMADDGITGGCSNDPLIFCPDAPVSRAQMAVFIETALGVGTPLPCSGRVFDDVNAETVGVAFCGFIEDFATRGITGGCSLTPPLFCPNDPVTRAQMAVFLVAAPDPLKP
jgi:RHS repeat-associated protein